MEGFFSPTLSVRNTCSAVDIMSPYLRFLMTNFIADTMHPC